MKLSVARLFHTVLFGVQATIITLNELYPLQKTSVFSIGSI